MQMSEPEEPWVVEKPREKGSVVDVVSFQVSSRYKPYISNTAFEWGVSRAGDGLSLVQEHLLSTSQVSLKTKFLSSQLGHAEIAGQNDWLDSTGRTSVRSPALHLWKKRLLLRGSASTLVPCGLTTAAKWLFFTEQKPGGYSSSFLMVLFFTPMGPFSISLRSRRPKGWRKIKEVFVAAALGHPWPGSYRIQTEVKGNWESPGEQMGNREN